VFVVDTADATAPLQGGSRFFGLVGTQTGTSAALTVTLWGARRLTKASAMGSAAITTGTITRTQGSFLTDGWKVGDSIGFRNTANLPTAADTLVLGVSDLTLTFAASSFTAETPPASANAEFWRLSLMGTSTIAPNAGFTASVPAEDVFTANKPYIDATPNRALAVGKDSGFFVSLKAALGAGLYADITPLFGDY